MFLTNVFKNVQITINIFLFYACMNGNNSTRQIKFMLEQHHKQVFFFFFFLIFWPCWVFIAALVFLQLRQVEAILQLQCAGFSSQWLLLLRSTGSRAWGFSSCGEWAQLLWSMWDPPRAGIEPAPPALAGGFLTIEPSRKPPKYVYF